MKLNIPETLCTFNGLFWITTSKIYIGIYRIFIKDQNGELENRQNDFLLRNFYDKVKDIAESTYDKKWLDSNSAAAIDRKWQSFPYLNSKVRYQYYLTDLECPKLG